MFAIKRYVRGTTPTHAQGYFRASMLMLVTFDVFTLSPYSSTAAMFGRVSMRSTKQKRRFLDTPVVEPGNWQGEILANGFGSFTFYLVRGRPAGASAHH
jgi:hypothetical protein